MKQIKDMSFDEFRERSHWLECLSHDALILSEALTEIDGNEDAHEALKGFSDDVASLDKAIYNLKDTLEASWSEISAEQVRCDAEVFVRHMMMLCKNISVNLSYRFNNLFGWTEVDIHEVINGFIDDTNLG